MNLKFEVTITNSKASQIQLNLLSQAKDGKLGKMNRLFEVTTTNSKASQSKKTV